MNKLYRYILVGIFALIPCFSNAGLELKYTHTADPGNDKSYTCTQGNLICARIGYCPQFDFNFDHGNQANSMGSWSNNPVPNQLGVCSSNTTIYYTTSSSCDLYLDCYEITEYTSLQCETEYNLIPINSVTAQYCKTNFDLISPTECPTSEGTGAVSWTAWYINNEQYPGTASLNIFIPEFLKYSTTYNENQTILDIEGYNADEDYINNVIDQEKLTPTNEDFTNMILALTGFIPYLFIALLFFWIVRIINKIWR